MITPSLFFSKDDSCYFWTGRDNCDKCHKVIELKGLLVWDFWQTQFIEKVYCFYCKDEIIKTAGKYSELKPFTIGFRELLPSDIIPVKPERPSLINATGMSVFDIATMPSESRVVNKTILSKPLLENRKEVLQISGVQQ